VTEILQFLDQNSGALTVIFTAVVTISTVIYALLTGILVLETRRLRQVQTEPRIQITVDGFDFTVNIVRLSISNIGQGPARNLRFSTSVISGGESAEKLLAEFTSSNFFRTGLRYFGPAQHIYSGYTQVNVDYEGKSNSILSFKVSYENLNGQKYEEELLVDMAELKGRYQLGTPNLYSIAKSLEKIQKDVHHFSTGFKRLKVDAYDSADREEEEREREEWRKESMKEVQES